MALLELMRGMGYGPSGKRGRYVPTDFVRAFVIGAAKLLTTPATLPRWRSRTGSRTKRRQLIDEADLLQKRASMMMDWAEFPLHGIGRIGPCRQRHKRSRIERPLPPNRIGHGKGPRMTRNCLIVIDMRNDFLDRVGDDGRAELIVNANQLIDLFGSTSPPI